MLVVEGLSKTYSSFSLQDVSFEVPTGYITGFIGVDGAGKTTTLKSIMNIVRPEAGFVTFQGRDLHAHEVEAKQRIGLLLGPVDVYPKHQVRAVVDVCRRFYEHWDSQTYRGLLDRFDIDDHKQIGELSAGMRVQLGMTLALSHRPQLLVLDEPTSGLDPAARHDLLGLLQEVVEDGEHSVLFTSHIPDELEKCADYVVVIRDGQIIANDAKHDLTADHVLVKGSVAELTDGLKQRFIGYKRLGFSFSGLALATDLQDLPGSSRWHTEQPDLGALMLYYNLRRSR